MVRRSFVLLVASIGLASTVRAEEPFDAFLAKHCLRCHGPDNEEGELRTDRLSSSHIERYYRAAQTVLDRAFPTEPTKTRKVRKTDDANDEVVADHLQRFAVRAWRRSVAQVIDQVVAPEGQPPTEVQKRLFGETPSQEADLRKAARQVARPTRETSWLN